MLHCCYIPATPSVPSPTCSLPAHFRSAHVRRSGCGRTNRRARAPWKNRTRRRERQRRARGGSRGVFSAYLYRVNLHSPGRSSSTPNQITPRGACAPSKSLLRLRPNDGRRLQAAQAAPHARPRRVRRCRLARGGRGLGAASGGQVGRRARGRRGAAAPRGPRPVRPALAAHCALPRLPR
uniref:Uncharacterized protein n=1 Tax=Setaria viridis TaxID=4556 RepID=A0A4U6UM85_SETVI|nr:hypothetical protein SEVIR_5G287332v2 [Setaria viridis]